MYEEIKKINWLSLFVKVVIFVVFVLLVIWLFIKISDRNVEKTFEENMNTLKSASIEFFKNGNLPIEIGENKIVTLEELIKMKYLSDFDSSCSRENSYAQATLVDDYYALRIELECGENKDYIYTSIDSEGNCVGDDCNAEDDPVENVTPDDPVIENPDDEEDDTPEDKPQDSGQTGGGSSNGGSSGGSSGGTSTGGGAVSNSGFIYPVPSAYARITTGIYYSSGQYHGGVDFGSGGINGQPVYAVQEGVVVTAKALNYSYGNHVIIAHPNGLYTLYAHGQMGSIRVSEGQYVSRGQQIMNVGSTGNSTGPHLHFEVRKSPGTYSNRVNPIPYLP